MSKDDTKKRGIEKKSKANSNGSLRGKKLNLIGGTVKKYSARIGSSLGDISKKVKTKMILVSNSHKEKKNKNSKKSKYYEGYPKLDPSDKDDIEKHIKTISGYNEALKSDPLLKYSKDSKSSDDSDFFRRLVKNISSIDFLSYPFGIKLLILFCLSNALLFFILALKFPYLMYFGFNLEGNSARYILIFFSLVNLVVSSGLLLRKKWSVFISVSWYGIGLISSFVTLFFLDKTILGILYDFFLFGLIVTSIINLSVIAYIIHRKEFFSSSLVKKLSISKFDYFFISLLSLFTILCIIFGAYLSLNFFTKVSGMVSEYGPLILQYNSLDEGMKFCESTSDSDICILIYSVMLEKEIPPTELVTACKSVHSPFIRYTCYEGLNIR